MSFSSYPIITYGSNIDIIRQGHNYLAANIGDMDGLQTAVNETIVDAINSLNSAFSALTVSAYPPLNNEQWLTATIASGFGTLNLFKLSNTNEFVIGQHVIPLSTLTDLGKVGTAWRAGHITTLNTAKVQAVTNLEIASTSTLTFSFPTSSLILTQVSATSLKLESTGEGLDIKSVQTRLYSGAFLWDITTSGHLEPGVTQAQNVGSAAKEVGTVFAKNLTVSGDVAFNGNVSMPNAGNEVKIGGGYLWFHPTIPDNYMIADGSAISRTAYAELFALWGTYHGIGNGSTTFNLPDMRKRFPFGADASQTSTPDASSPGKTFGILNHTHNSTLPKHYHTSSGLSITDHTSQVTGVPSVLPSANFTGSALPPHPHSIQEPNGGLGHSHGYTEGSGGLGHGHNMSDPGHYHGATLNDHSHTLDAGGKGSGNTSGNPASWAGSSAGQIGLFSGLTPITDNTFGAGALGVTVSPASVVSQGLTVVFNTTGISINQAVSGISVISASAGTPAGTVALTNTSHSHTIPTLTHSISGTVGITSGAGGSNGDVDQTLVSTINNPPAFCVHFIIRVK